MNINWIQKLKIAIASLALLGLTACGGAGGGGDKVPAQTIQGAIASGVVVVPESEASAITLTLDSSLGDTLNVGNPTGILANAQTGQIVALPANDAQGIPFGLTAKVKRNTDGSISLQPAAVEDVFTKLSVDFDTARDGAKIAGLISPKNGSISLSQTKTPSSLQSGLEFSACQLGLTVANGVICKNGALEGTISLEHKLNVKKKGGTEISKATLYATINISKLAAKVKVEFDPKKYPDTGGFNQAMVKLTGEFGAQIGIKLDDAAFTADIPSIPELIRGDGVNIWDENTKIKFGKYFELSGLNGDDKKGLIPLAGFYLTPAGGAVPFGGDLSAAQLGQIKAGAVIVWVYIDLSGNITLSGDLSFFKFNGAYIEKGFDITPVNGALETRVFDQKTMTNAHAPYITGSANATQNIGLALVGDLLVGGIRPFSVKAQLMGVNATLNVNGEGGYRLWPEPTALEGNFCYNYGIKAYSDITFRSAIKAKLDAGWVQASAGYERTFGPSEYIWKNTGDAGCVNNYLLGLSATVIGQDATDPSKRTVQINFVNAYNQAPLRNQTGIWRLYIDSALSSTWVDVDSSYAGNYSIPLATGVYQLTMAALHQDLKDGIGNPVAIKTSDTITLTVSTVPLVDFSAKLQQGDCKKLVLTSLSSAGANASLTDYKWVVTPSGGSPITQQGSNISVATFALPACGTVEVNHTVTDNLGASTMLVKTINTNALAPSVTNVSPAIATVNTPQTFTVTGTNLPPTTTFLMPDANCQAITPTTSGFTVSCTPTLVGSKGITITDAAGNPIAGGTMMVNVSAAAVVATGALNDTGITANQCYQAGSDVLVSCTSAAAIVLNNTQDGMIGRDVTANNNADGKAGFSFSLVPKATGGTYANTECVQDNVTGLMWEGKTNDGGLRDWTKIYTNYDSTLSLQKSNGTAPTQAEIDAPTNSIGFVNAVNAQGLCSFNDWRLPTADELQSMVDYGVAFPGPTIDTAWFPNTRGNAFWSASSYVGGTYYAWFVYFDNGYVDSYGRNGSFYVRLVRASQ